MDAAQARRIAEALRARTGQAWDLVTEESEQPGWGFYIDGPHRLRLHMEDAVASSHHYIYGVYPPTRMQVDRHSCKVRTDRGPAAIAGEIARRVLPDYTHALAEVLAYEAKQLADYAGRVDAVHEAEELFGARSDFEPYDSGPGRMRAQEVSVSLPLRGAFPLGKHGVSEHARVEASDGGALLSLDLKNVPAPVVLRMLRVLADYTATLPYVTQHQPREPKPFSAEFERLYDEWLFSGAFQRIS